MDEFAPGFKLTSIGAAQPLSWQRGSGGGTGGSAGGRPLVDRRSGGGLRRERSCAQFHTWRSNGQSFKTSRPVGPMRRKIRRMERGHEAMLVDKAQDSTRNVVTLWMRMLKAILFQK